MIFKLRFLAVRLRHSSCAELVHRLRELFFILRCFKKTRSGNLSVVAPPLKLDEICQLSSPDLVISSSANNVENLLNVEVICLSFDETKIRKFETQNRGTYFSKVRWGKNDPDIRAVWEPARLQHLVRPLVWDHNDLPPELSERLKTNTKRQLLDWIERTPFLYGPQYISVMECALRIPLFFIALKNLPLEDEEADAIISTIFKHAWLIEKRLSLYSSLGNHTICEAVGLAYAGAIFRKTLVGKQWLKRGIQLLKQELPHQVLPDGGPVEQSLNYHRFVLDLYWLAVSFLEVNNLFNCADFKPSLLRGEIFLKMFSDVNGKFPAIGDSDDGYAISPGMIPFRGVFVKEKKGFSSFPDTGYKIYRYDDGTIVTFDCGPLGMAPFYNHGHADALSITVTKNSEQLLLDPGTYRYNGAPDWRRYFRGTRAHNTVTIDGLDQAVQETSFIWSKPFTTKVIHQEKTKSGIFVEVTHDGYQRLKNPVTHKRSIFFAKNNYLLIKDTFSGRGVHEYELNYHVHPTAKLKANDGWWHVQNGESSLSIALFNESGFSLISGQDSPPLGWFSPAYGIKQKSGVLQASAKGSPEDVSFCTVISLSGESNMKILENFAKEL